MLEVVDIRRVILVGDRHRRACHDKQRQPEPALIVGGAGVEPDKVAVHDGTVTVDAAEIDEAVEDIAPVGPSGLVDAATTSADEVEAPAEYILADTEHVAVALLGPCRVVAVGHDQADPYLIACLLLDPLQRALVAVGAVGILVPVEEVDAQELEALVDDMAYEAFDPLLRSVLVSVDPIDEVIELGIADDVARALVVASLYAALGVPCRARHPQRVVVETGDEAAVLAVFHLVAEGLVPAGVVLGDVAVGIDGLRAFNPSVGTYHFVAGIAEVFGHPVHVVVEAVFVERPVFGEAFLVGHPVERSCGMAVGTLHAV